MGTLFWTSLFIARGRESSDPRATPHAVPSCIPCGTLASRMGWRIPWRRFSSSIRMMWDENGVHVKCSILLISWCLVPLAVRERGARAYYTVDNWKTQVGTKVSRFSAILQDAEPERRPCCRPSLSWRCTCSRVSTPPGYRIAYTESGEPGFPI